MAEFRKQRELLQQEHSVFTPGKRQFSSRNDYGYNRSLLLPLIAILAAVPVILWLVSGGKPDGPESIKAQRPLSGANYDSQSASSEPMEAKVASLYDFAAKSTTTEELEARVENLTRNLQEARSLTAELESRLRSSDKLEERISELTKNLETLNSLTTDLDSVKAAADALEAQISGLTESMDNLNRKVRQQALVRKKPKAQTDTSTEPSTVRKPSRQTPATASVAEPESAQGSLSTKRESSAVAETPGDAPTEATKATSTDASPGSRSWVINLISSPDKEDAIYFSKRAKAKGFSPEIEEVLVKDRTYWRVQVTGFATREEAEAYSETLKEELKLKETWIIKR